MDKDIKVAFEKSKYGDKDERYEAYQTILEVTEREVDWAFDVWDQLLEDLSHKDNHQRSRAAQYLANLAKSDPEKRMLKDSLNYGKSQKMSALLRRDIVCKQYGK